MSDSRSDSTTGREPADSPGDGADEREERQEKVLHTRISPTLDREIKRRARGLGMSVSTVVRNVLLHTFDLVEDIVNDSAGIALSLAGDEEAARDNPRKGAARSRTGEVAAGPAVVIAWQEAVLNLNAVCDRCNAILASGTKAAIGICDTPGPRSIICTACVEALGNGSLESDR